MLEIELPQLQQSERIRADLVFELGRRREMEPDPVAEPA
jgi:hypothetical protein